MRIGRDHIASTVYTIAFAYAGAALPVLILVMLYDQPVLDALTSGQLAEEVVRTLAGSIGLVLAVPVTTALAVLVVKASTRAKDVEPASAEGRRPVVEEALDSGSSEAVHESRRARREAEAQGSLTR
jgi:hypothetical protein